MGPALNGTGFDEQLHGLLAFPRLPRMATEASSASAVRLQARHAPEANVPNGLEAVSLSAFRPTDPDETRIDPVPIGSDPRHSPKESGEKLPREPRRSESHTGVAGSFRTPSSGKRTPTPLLGGKSAAAAHQARCDENTGESAGGFGNSAPLERAVRKAEATTTRSSYKIASQGREDRRQIRHTGECP